MTQRSFSELQWRRSVIDFGGGIVMGCYAKNFLLGFVTLLFWLAAASPVDALTSDEQAEDLAIRLHQRIAGVPPPSAEILQEMKERILSNQVDQAAFMAMQSPSFYQVTLLRIFNPLSNREGANNVPLTDFTATMIGAVRDNVDARQILAGDLIYTANDQLQTYTVTINVNHCDGVGNESCEPGCTPATTSPNQVSPPYPTQFTSVRIDSPTVTNWVPRSTNPNDGQAFYHYCARVNHQIRTNSPPMGRIRPLLTSTSDTSAFYRDFGHYLSLQSISNWVNALQARSQSSIYGLLQGDQRLAAPDIAGVLTTREGFELNFLAGTNRTLVEKIFKNFLGYTLLQLADPTQGHQFARQDIGRSDFPVFEQTCAGCHQQVDAMANAANLFDYELNEERFRLRSSPAANIKLFRGCVNPDTPGCSAPDGFNPRQLPEADWNRWWLFWNQGRNSFLGWRTPAGMNSISTGRGLGTLARVIAETEAYSNRFAHLFFDSICLRAPTPNESLRLRTLARSFEQGIPRYASWNAANPYNLKALMAGVSSMCFQP